MVGEKGCRLEWSVLVKVTVLQRTSSCAHRSQKRVQAQELLELLLARKVEGRWRSLGGKHGLGGRVLHCFFMLLKKSAKLSDTYLRQQSDRCVIIFTRGPH